MTLIEIIYEYLREYVSHKAIGDDTDLYTIAKEIADIVDIESKPKYESCDWANTYEGISGIVNNIDNSYPHEMIGDDFWGKSEIQISKEALIAAGIKIGGTDTDEDYPDLADCYK